MPPHTLYTHHQYTVLAISLVWRRHRCVAFGDSVCSLLLLWLLRLWLLSNALKIPNQPKIIFSCAAAKRHPYTVIRREALRCRGDAQSVKLRVSSRCYLNDLFDGCLCCFFYWRFSSSSSSAPLDVSSFRLLLLLLLYFRYFDLFCCALIFLGGSPPNICFWRLTTEMTTTPPTSTTESQDFDYIFACVFIDVLSFSMVVTVALLHFFFLVVLLLYLVRFRILSTSCSFIFLSVCGCVCINKCSRWAKNIRKLKLSWLLNCSIDLPLDILLQMLSLPPSPSLSNLLCESVIKAITEFFQNENSWCHQKNSWAHSLHMIITWKTKSGVEWFSLQIEIFWFCES